MEALRTFLIIDALLIVALIYLYAIVRAYNEQQKMDEIEVKE